MTKKITKISAQKSKGRYNLDLDGKFAFGISEMTLIKFGLAKNRELNEKEINEIKKYEDITRAISKSLNYLSHHLRTEKEIFDKLRSLEFNNATIKAAIARLKDEKYLDDKIYAENFVRTQANLQAAGPLVISQKLKLVGIPNTDIEAALAVYETNDQMENALSLAEKYQKHYSKNSIIKQKQKINQALYAKGYDSDLIKATIDKLVFEEDNQQQLENARRTINHIWSRYDKYGREKAYRARSYLYGKGFPAEIIDQVIGEKENDGTGSDFK
ncbi:Regulatory protein RecX [Oenococcus oeni]|uniref:Regulatory protein RecX n=2 Tax=Oenococcus oeni TaxID=1247 RepID=A0AAQ2UWZ8_OENOE|nr:recombination regulator RecX [Oenococcus oeni]SYW06708.1 Regulatory protein RecX [Oenococcus oeni]VDB99097.1 Regulatory protein RecX [Oenococcus oeni]